MVITAEKVLAVKEETCWNKEENDGKSQEILKDNETSRKTSYWEGLVHMFRGTVGTGILALPSAFNQAGYLGGTLGVIVVTFMVNYCAVSLAKSQLELSRRRKATTMTYQATVGAAFEEGPKVVKNLAPIFMKATNSLLLFGQIVTNCTYVIFIATNLKEVLDPYLGFRSLREYIAWTTPFIMATNLVISLKKMAIVSMFGNAVLLSSIAVIFYYVTQDLPSLEERNMFGQVKDIPFFVGTVFFASGCITLILPLQNNMKKPSKMSSRFGVLNMAAFLTGTLHLIFGLLGYLKYGPVAKQGTVTVNLPPSSISVKLVQIFLSVSTMTATAIHNYVVVDLMWEDYLCNIVEKNVSLVKYSMRIVLVLITVLGAMVVPNLKMLIALVGIMSQCTLSSTLPCIIHMFTYHVQPTIWAYIKKFYIDIIVLTFNFFILISELSKIITDIIQNFH